MADVTPLPKDHRVRLRTFLPPPPAPRQPYRPPPERSRDDEPEDTDTDTAYVAPGVDRRALRKLRRGQYVAGRHLDLHGLTSKEALVEVAMTTLGSKIVNRAHRKMGEIAVDAVSH